MVEARKISFQEAWDSSVVFFVDEDLEREIEAKVEALLETAENHRVSETAGINVPDIADFLRQHDNGLDVILKDIGLSEEKFKCTISLLWKLGRIGSDFDNEWGIGNIKAKIAHEPDFALTVAQLLVDGKRDEELQRHAPRSYLDALDYREIERGSPAVRRIRYRESVIRTYEAQREQRVEERIRAQLERIKAKHAVNYVKVHPLIVKIGTGLFVVPSFEDPWVIIMSSFNETTSSGQSTKARDMLAAYERVQHQNSRYGENRAFVNFADGGGWLARKRDLERLVNNCHYFINLQYLDLLEAIVLQHVPGSYFT